MLVFDQGKREIAVDEVELSSAVSDTSTDRWNELKHRRYMSQLSANTIIFCLYFLINLSTLFDF